jgi:hypothetical protein
MPSRSCAATTAGIEQRINQHCETQPAGGGDHRFPVIIVFLFHFRSAADPDSHLTDRLVISFIPMYYPNVSSKIISLGGLALAVRPNTIYLIPNNSRLFRV